MSKVLPDSNNHTCHEIALVLQLNLSTVRFWIQRGWLKANKHTPKHYEIGIGHLKQFLEHPPHQIRKRIAAIDTQAINCLLGKNV